MSPVAMSLEELIPSSHVKSHVYSILIRTALVISTLLVALSIPFFGKFINDNNLPHMLRSSLFYGETILLFKYARFSPPDNICRSGDGLDWFFTHNARCKYFFVYFFVTLVLLHVI